MFFKSGDLIYKLRWWVIGAWIALILCCLPFIPHLIAPFKTVGFVDELAKSTLAQQHLDHKLGYRTENQVLVLYQSKRFQANGAKFKQKIKSSLAKLYSLPVKVDIFYPQNNSKQVSQNQHSAYAIINVHEDTQMTSELIKNIRQAIKKPKDISISLGGNPILIEDVNHQTHIDLLRADIVAAPIALITLILAFGSVVSASLPLILGGGGAILILTSLYFIGHYIDLSIFTLNIALLLGLCLCLDYCLFVVNRFRDELVAQPDIIGAISQTLSTAGKAIFFSGLAVVASLSALLLFSINILTSIAIGGIIAVFFAVFTAIIFLPATLCILKNRVNNWSVHLWHRHSSQKAPFWNKLATLIVSRPLTFFFPVMLMLLLLGYPFLSAKFGVTGFKIFPSNSEKRVFINTFAKEFQLEELTPIQITFQAKKGNILDKNNFNKLYKYIKKIEKLPNVTEVNSIVTVSSKLSKQQYLMLYQNKKKMKQSMRQLLNTTTTDKLTLIQVVSKYPPESTKTKQLIENLKDIKPGVSIITQFSGKPVSDLDVISHITSVLPYALAWIILSSYLILLFLLRSLFLPIKAILMNILSLCACYGALVLVFQDGYLHQLLNFEPQGMLDISLLVIIFCALFGFSMDYEVFLLTRIKECYEKTNDNNLSIIFGIEKSSRIITCAALIVIVLCGAFLVADVIMVKAFGLGIAVAIFVDAFLVRTLFVPSAMTLMKDWNWYLPKWLGRVLP